MRKADSTANGEIENHFMATCVVDIFDSNRWWASEGRQEKAVHKNLLRVNGPVLLHGLQQQYKHTGYDFGMSSCVLLPTYSILS